TMTAAHAAPWKDYRGLPLSPSASFIKAPPAEIGELVGASVSLAILIRRKLPALGWKFWVERSGVYGSA
ncbi:MAG: hypothetical protein M3470_09800, partial [Chloroflexota bacterium]|nr:hypothetical protein [Chloroflexota bacterium]